MTAQNALEGLLPFALDAEDVSVVIAAEEEEEEIPALRRALISDEVAEDFRDAALAGFPGATEIDLLPYEPSYKPRRHEWMYLALDEAGDVADIVEGIMDLQALELFHAEDEILRDLLFYATVMSDSAQTYAVFFRNYSEKKELGRRGGFAVFLDEGQFNRVEYKTFLFDDDIDCVAWDEYIYIKNPFQFHRMFRFFERLRERADEIIDRVATAVPISNVDEFREVCRGQMQMMSKLASIARQPYLDQLTIDVMKQTIDAAGLDISVIDEDGEERLLYEGGTQAKRWAILKLLDDDYLRSLMTQLIYESSSKRSL